MKELKTKRKDYIVPLVEFESISTSEDVLGIVASVEALGGTEEEQPLDYEEPMFEWPQND